MNQLKEEEVLKECCVCGREGCDKCLPKDIEKPCKSCREDIGDEEGDDEEEDAEA
jgi:hypothetical protein